MYGADGAHIIRVRVYSIVGTYEKGKKEREREGEVGRINIIKKIIITFK